MRFAFSSRHAKRAEARNATFCQKVKKKCEFRFVTDHWKMLLLPQKLIRNIITVFSTRIRWETLNKMNGFFLKLILAKKSRFGKMPKRGFSHNFFTGPILLKICKKLNFFVSVRLYFGKNSSSNSNLVIRNLALCRTRINRCSFGAKYKNSAYLAQR